MISGRRRTRCFNNLSYGVRIALWSDLWQSAAVIRGLSDVDVHANDEEGNMVGISDSFIV